MAQNTIIKGVDNPVTINFAFAGKFAANGLDNFTEITLEIGGEVYSTVDDPMQLRKVGKKQLELWIGDVTTLEAGNYVAEINGFSDTYNDGYLINGLKNKKLGHIQIK